MANIGEGIAPEYDHHNHAQERDHWCLIAVGIAMNIHAELVVADPVPCDLNDLALPDHSKQCSWGCSEASDEQVLREPLFAFARRRISDHRLGNPSAWWPVRFDPLSSFFCPQRPGGITSVAFLMIGCHDKDIVPSQSLAADLAVQRLLVGRSRPLALGAAGI